MPCAWRISLAMSRFSTAKKILTGAALLCLAALLLCLPQPCADALRGGLLLCSERLIPSLLPFLFLTEFTLRSGLVRAVGAVLSGVTRRVFHLPGICSVVLIMALIGGYPVGLRLSGELARGGLLSVEEARRMTRFCVGAGPAFVILAVGQTLLSSPRAGYILYSALLLSALIIALIVPSKAPRLKKSSPSTTQSYSAGEVMNLVTTSSADSLPQIKAEVKAETDYGSAFIGSVSQAARQMLLICVWTLLFCGLCAYLPLFLPSPAAQVFASLLEVSLGSQYAAATGSLPLLCAVLAWGGLCVHCQLGAAIKLCGQTLPRFWFWRLCHAGLAFLICRGLLLIFHVEITPASAAVSATANAELWQLSAPAALGLAAMGLGLLLQVADTRRAAET
ncbi:MAG: hypothetical protein LBQ80_01920 [Clostridium sp.]|nr:hypothetical protein [Clostridium sp.]